MGTNVKTTGCSKLVNLYVVFRQNIHKIDVNTWRYNDLHSAYQKEYFDVKKQLQF